ncbi:T-lymphocyte surface antigen Ly-9-like [Dendropsophus ebraccatus]|uniref:T-lymphocyte surface antigen Ly-9-like n=1 Tax=Dendropsophus ebraccatus TaxID=150705 RepID=UPI0038316FF4
MITQGMLLLLLLLIPLWGVFSDVNEQALLAMCGGSILFQVNVPMNIEVTSIFWTYTEKNRRTEKKMLAIVKPNELRVISERFRNRVDSQEPDFSLLLSNLNEEDSGLYEAKIFTDADTIHSYFILQVYGVISDVPKERFSEKCGGSILFPVNIPMNIVITSIFWTHTGTEKKMLAFVRPDQLRVFIPRFLSRVISQQNSFSLLLSNLNEEDSGIYEAQIHTNTTIMHKRFILQVHGCKLSLTAKTHSYGVQRIWSSVVLIISLGITGVFFNSFT